MSANPSTVKLIYESGSRQTINCPDLSFADGAYLQSEFIDLSDIDSGIFWWREEMQIENMYDDGEIPSEEVGQNWYQIGERARIISGERLKKVIIVQVDGEVVFVRHPGAKAACGLAAIYNGEFDSLSDLDLSAYIAELIVGNKPYDRPKQSPEVVMVDSKTGEIISEEEEGDDAGDSHGIEDMLDFDDYS